MFDVINLSFQGIIDSYFKKKLLSLCEETEYYLNEIYYKKVENIIITIIKKVIQIILLME
jgi:hypothetical protein